MLRFKCGEQNTAFPATNYLSMYRNLIIITQLVRRFKSMHFLDAQFFPPFLK